MAKSHEADGSKRPGTRGPSLPEELKDFKADCTLRTDEKEFVIEVGKILRRHPSHNNIRQFVKWTEDQHDRPEWTKCTTRKLKDSLYDSLNCSAKRIPPWPMVAWIIAGSISHNPERDDIEQQLATKHKRLTGVHPVGYVTRPLLGEPPLTADEAPDTETEMLLLRKEVSAKDAELSRIQHQLTTLSSDVTRLESALADTAENAELVGAMRAEINEMRTTIVDQRNSLRREHARWRGRTTELALASTRSANHMAVTAAWLDAHGIMHADFDSCVRLLNVQQYPDAQMPRILAAPVQLTYRPVTRWITVHLRAFILSRYGEDIEAANIDDSTGQLSALVLHGTLPSAAAVRPLVRAHGLLQRFVPRLLEEAAAECQQRADERSGFGDTTVLDVIPPPGTNDEHGLQPVTTFSARPASRLPSAQGSRVGAPSDELSERRHEKLMNSETVFLQISTLTQQDMTEPNAAERVIAQLRAMESRTA